MKKLHSCSPPPWGRTDRPPHGDLLLTRSEERLSVHNSIKSFFNVCHSVSFTETIPPDPNGLAVRLSLQTEVTRITFGFGTSAEP